MRDRMRIGWVAAVLLALLGTGARAAGTQDGKADSELAKALARPLSPGSVAILVLHADNPAAAARLTEALAHEQPEVRAVAARVAFAIRHRGLVPALVKALVVEQNSLAGAEIVRALALILGRTADDALFENFERFDSRAPAAWLEVVERARPIDLLPRLDKLPASAPIGAAMATYAAAHANEVAQACATMASGSPVEQIYVSMIGAAFERKDPLPWPVLAAGINAGGAPRRAVVHDLLWRRGQGIPPDAEAGLVELTGRVTIADDPWLVVALELSRRGRPAEGPPRPIGEAIAALSPTVSPKFGGGPFLHTLTAEEEGALRKAPGTWLAPRAEWTNPTSPRTVAVSAAGAGGSVSRLVRPLTPGVLADILTLTGCKPRADQVVAIDVSYRPTGQVRNVSQPVGLGFSNKDCNDAARLLAILDTATGHEPVAAERTDLVLVGLRPEDIDCKRASTNRSGTPAVVGAGVQPPRKIRQVNPEYPPGLQQQGKQGVVILRAIISTEGCVAEAEVFQSAHLGFNAAALIAVSGWRYTPTIVDGVEVPVIMTVTVNFTLRR